MVGADPKIPIWKSLIFWWKVLRSFMGLTPKISRVGLLLVTGVMGKINRKIQKQKSIKK